MPTPRDELEDLARELDMLVYRLEVTPPVDVDASRRERSRLRRELEAVRERVEDVARRLD